MADTFDEQMIALHLSVNGAYADEVKRLRRENAELRAVIASAPATLYEFQERVVLLEKSLLERGGNV